MTLNNLTEIEKNGQVISSNIKQPQAILWFYWWLGSRWKVALSVPNTTSQISQSTQTLGVITNSVVYFQVASQAITVYYSLRAPYNFIRLILKNTNIFSWLAIARFWSLDRAWDMMVFLMEYSEFQFLVYTSWSVVLVAVNQPCGKYLCTYSVDT